jgi:Pyruvate/2-oxoacid:ferredoxin oxidoreductase delta subunit
MYYAASLKDETSCDGCGLCVLSCPEANTITIVKLSGKKKTIAIREMRCKGCALCVELCPQKALQMALR